MDDYERGRRDGWQQCLATTSQWSGLKGSLDRLSGLLERVQRGELELPDPDLEVEVERPSAYLRSNS